MARVCFKADLQRVSTQRIRPDMTHPIFNARLWDSHRDWESDKVFPDKIEWMPNLQLQFPSWLRCRNQLERHCNWAHRLSMAQQVLKGLCISRPYLPFMSILSLGGLYVKVKSIVHLLRYLCRLNRYKYSTIDQFERRRYVFAIRSLSFFVMPMYLCSIASETLAAMRLSRNWLSMLNCKTSC